MLTGHGSLIILVPDSDRNRFSLFVSYEVTSCWGWSHVCGFWRLLASPVVKILLYNLLFYMIFN